MEKDTLFSGESVNVEYKVAVPKDSSKYMKTVVAYANGRGGKIIFGVDDKTLKVLSKIRWRLPFSMCWKRLTWECGYRDCIGRTYMSFRWTVCVR